MAMTDGVQSDLDRAALRAATEVREAYRRGYEDAMEKLRGLVDAKNPAACGLVQLEGVHRVTNISPPATSKPKRQRVNPWARLSPADRLKRINAIRVGRGLPLRKGLAS